MDIKTALYVRVSTDNGTQTTDSQLHELHRYCEARGWTKYEVYEDKMSGAKTSRPRFDQMVQDMRNGKVCRIVCYKLDRMGRSLSHLALVIDEMNKRKIPLICTSQGLDTSDQNPCGTFQLQVLLAVAEFERGIIRERVNSGLNAAKARGVKLGRRSTLVGLKRDKVIELRSQGLGVREIGRNLKIPASSVSKILKSAQSVG